jgi:hypothetical protein
MCYPGATLSSTGRRLYAGPILKTAQGDADREARALTARPQCERAATGKSPVAPNWTGEQSLEMCVVVGRRPKKGTIQDGNNEEKAHGRLALLLFVDTARQIEFSFIRRRHFWGFAREGNSSGGSRFVQLKSGMAYCAPTHYGILSEWVFRKRRQLLQLAKALAAFCPSKGIN